MRFTRFLTKEDKKQLEFEIVPQDLRIFLTRLLRRQIEERVNDEARAIVWQNMLVNMSHNLSEMPIYVLEPDTWEDYPVYEQIWHEGEMDLVLRRLNTFQFIEMMCELVERNWFKSEEINPLFEQANLTFRIVDSVRVGRDFSKVDEPQVEVLSIQDIEDQADQDEHPNIRQLVDRIDRNLEANDYSAVLHASASIFETLAKDIISSQDVEHKSLGSFFERYSKTSKLPKPVLDYVRGIYTQRNTEPLAGHGKTTAPSVSKDEAITIAEMTKAFVKIEYQLRRETLQVKRPDKNA